MKNEGFKISKESVDKLFPKMDIDILGYESPIQTIINQTATAIAKKADDNIWEAVAKTGVAVDKDELIKALRYDRGQYEKGYKQGKADATREMINDVKEILLDYHLRENKKYRASTTKTKKQFDIETARLRAITDAVKFAITTLNETEKKYIGKDNNVPTNTEDMG